jgi:phage tail sheath protein FI
MAVIKTPGVYIAETNAFPNSVVQVATAVPAFVGYTGAAANDGVSLLRKPWRISSMSEYEHFFGGAPTARFKIEAVKPQVAVPAPTDRDMLQARGQRSVFCHGGKTYLLTRAAGRAGGRFLMHQAMRHFFLNGGGPCYVVSVGDFDDEIVAGDKTMGLVGGLTPLLDEGEPTLIVVPDAVLLSRPDCVVVQRAVLEHCGSDTKKRFAILDVWGGDLDRRNPAGDCIDWFRAASGTNFLDYAAAYYPWLHTSLSGGGELDQRSIEKSEDLAALLGVDASLLAALTHEACLQLNLMPPSAAMAGVYTMVDNNRGVWKAPANVGIAGVIKPAIAISDADQEDLNVTPQGKSINAIRSFMGEGVLVWGARTLDGNSLDWRYINVRRTAIMLEESCRLAIVAMVFEPNVADTWEAIKRTIGNFLNGIWKQGGLAGAAPADAFSVSVGLGETMTADDILEGILRVAVRVAITRPAEFQEFTVQQQMQGS